MYEECEVCEVVPLSPRVICVSVCECTVAYEMNAILWRCLDGAREGSVS